MINKYLSIIVIITILQSFSFSYATKFYKDDFEMLCSQDKKILLNENAAKKRNKPLTIEDNEAQTTQMSPLISDALLSFHSNINLMPIPSSFPVKIGFQKRMLFNINTIPSEVWIHIASYLHYSTSQLHQVNHYFFEVVTSYPVIALLKTSEYLQSLESDKSEHDKEQQDNEI